jgi:hypothetical protein
VSQRAVVKVEGEAELMRDFAQLGKAGQVAGLRVAGRVCARVVPQAKALTPVEAADGGALRDSIRTTKPTVTRAGRVSAGVAAGGAPLRRLASERGRALPGQYGSIVHEDLTLKHTSGEPKFVEKPFFREVASVPDELRDEMDELTSSLGGS